MNRHEERRRRKQLRQKARRAARQLSTPGINDDEPCCCGGSFFLRVREGGLEAAHSDPPCRHFEAVSDFRQLEAFVHLQRRACLNGQVHTVPWFPEMQAEMPGYIVHSLGTLLDISQGLGLRYRDDYVQALLGTIPGIDEDTALDIIALGIELGIIGGSEVPPGTPIMATAPGVN